MSTSDPNPRAGNGLLTTLRRYWASRGNGPHLPSRRDIDPVDLPQHLAHIMLIDGVGERYRFRLVGTTIGRLLARDPTARFLDDVLSIPELDAIESAIAQVIESGQPLQTPGAFTWLNGWNLPVTWLFLPLASDGRRVDMILTALETSTRPTFLPRGQSQLRVDWRPPAFDWQGFTQTERGHSAHQTAF